MPPSVGSVAGGPTVAPVRVRGLSAPEVLRVWEVAHGQHPLDRALTLLAAACPWAAWEDLAALSVGQRDARLLDAREQTFGPVFSGFAECPHCGERLEFSFATSDVRAAPLSADGAEETLEASVGEGLALRFRLPTSHDLGAVAACGDVAAARRALVERCVLQATRKGEPIQCDDLSAEEIATLAVLVADRDPQAETLLDLHCPACEHGWQALFDVASFFWTELAAQARRLLREVHALARAYGWRELDILALSVRRRKAYLEMVGG